MTTIELDIELADNGAIFRQEDDKGYMSVEVVEGRADDVARYIGRLIVDQMDHDVEHKAKVKIEIEYN